VSGLLAKLRHEPVAFWGGLAGAFLAVLLFTGVVTEDQAGLITLVLGAVGIPVVRQQVTPVTKQQQSDDAGQASFGLLAMVAVITIGVFLGLTLHDWLHITHR
jgi:hypothetical protein